MPNQSEHAGCTTLNSHVLTYKGSPPRTPFTKVKVGYCSKENTADRDMTTPYSFPKWHGGKLHTHTNDNNDLARRRQERETSIEEKSHKETIKMKEHL